MAMACRIGYETGLDPNSTDSDNDGLSDAEELEEGSDPTVGDTDGDGVPDGQDAVPNDRDFKHPRRPVPHYAVIEIDASFGPTTVNDRGELFGSGILWQQGATTLIPGGIAMNNSGMVCGFKDDKPLKASAAITPPPQPPVVARAPTPASPAAPPAPALALPDAVASESTPATIVAAAITLDAKDHSPKWPWLVGAAGLAIVILILAWKRLVKDRHLNRK